MDSNSNSCELTWAKTEIDAEGSDDSFSKFIKPNWNSVNTMRLIYILEHDCKELWDIRHPMHKDKNARQARHEYLAETFGTTAEEIVRKLHNLRTQLNNELRKIKRRQSDCNDGSTPTSGWEYFDAMSFLVRQNTMDATDPLENVEGVNLALAEFQADEEIEFGARMKAAAAAAASPPKPKPVKTMRVAASAPPPLPPSAHPMMWPDPPLPTLRPGLSTDEFQIFGDFVASELRMLRTENSRRRLKRIIQKAILQISEDEEGSNW